MRSLDLYIAKIKFKQNNHYKYRPVLILAVTEKHFFGYEITGQYATKSRYFQSLYYPISFWKESELDEQSYIDVSKIIHLAKNRIVSSRPIGRLTQYDAKGLKIFLEFRQSNK